MAWAVSVSIALVIVLCLPSFFRVIGNKPGLVLDDPLLAALPAMDLSVPLFTLLYGVVVSFVVGIVRRPLLFLRIAQAYVLLLVLRMVAMFTLTLEPPPGLVDLQDPISALVYPDAGPFCKDLFFSGHTATVFLFFLAAPWRVGRYAMLFATVLVAVAVLVQHVHWTIDVLAAPFGAWLAWWISGRTSALSVSAGRRAA